MEFGEHCSYAPCKRLDFLPFTCASCNQVFCKDHCKPQTHECSQLEPEPIPPTVSTSREQVHSVPCSLEGCKKRDLVEMICPHCKQPFCLLHRHWEDHMCVGPERENRRDKPTVSRPASTPKGTEKRTTVLPNARDKKVLKGAKSESTSAKVAFMKLKLKAQGPDFIPQTERVYYDVCPPSNCRSPNKPMFFSKEWTVGRCVAFATEMFRARVETPQKLQLLSPSGEPLPMTKPLSSLLDAAPNGSTLTLDYQTQS